MNIINQVTELFSDFQNEMDDLKVQNEKLKKEISELRQSLIAGEELRSQYVLCCALHVKPEIIMQYVKQNET
jgi:cell shape-determining protein MreC